MGWRISGDAFPWSAWRFRPCLCSKKCKGYLLHVVIFFINIGPYHLSRLKAAYESCHANGWVLTAVQATDNALQHPWGNADEKIPFRLVNLQASGNIRYDPKWG